MIGATTQFVATPQAVNAAVKKASFRNFGHAAASIRKTAIASIKDEPGPSAYYTPPHTHTATTIVKLKRGRIGKEGRAARIASVRKYKGRLPESIGYDANADGAIIGPKGSEIGDIGNVHEFGGEYKGEDYPPRPFVNPALEENRDRFASDWAGSVTA